MKYKVGMRVREAATGDTGTIVYRATSQWLPQPSWYIKWDDNGLEQHLPESMMEPLMPKPKFLMSKQEMLAFNDDCLEAAHHCPQFRGWGYDDRDILLGNVKPADMVKTWLDCDVLWKYGYDECLSEDAKEVFDRYKDYKAEKRLWKKKCCAAT